LTFIVRVFVNDTIAIAVWTNFHVCVPRSRCTARLSIIWHKLSHYGVCPP
jgi:hypothetical protein